MNDRSSQHDLRARLGDGDGSSAFTRGALVLRRVVSAAAVNLARNLLPTITTVLIMTAMLGSILLMSAAGALGQHPREEVAKRITISLEIRDIASQNDVDALMRSVREFPHVADVTYVSKEDAARELAAQGLQVPDFLGGNPFANRLRIRTDDLGARAQILSFISTSRFKDLVVITERERLDSTYEQRVATIDQVIGSVQRIGISLAVLFALLAALVIVTTVRLAIYTRRDELAIMQLVGASRTSIMGPFVLETAFAGAIGAVLALALFVPVINLVFPNLSRFFEGFDLASYVTTQLPALLGGLLLVGVGLAALASLASTAWYLRRQPAI
jgi:cell division transport system permease protein